MFANRYVKGLLDMFSPLFRSSSLRVITATAAALTLPLASFALNGKAMREALVADYPLTKTLGKL